jgi:creatinine amidohydrolase
VTEQRYERLRPAELRALVAQAPVAWVPVGTLEFHGEHLPFGVDGFEAHGLLRRAAAQAGGVVLPPTYVASGCLAMPHTLTFDPALVHALTSATLDQLAAAGFETVVVLTGHGPLDLIHLLKRACSEAMERHPGLTAYGLCWLELNAARLTAPETGEPTAVDHAARVETSWMLALEPDLVALDRLADDPAAAHPGVYGANPRFTADAAWGEAQIGAAAELLAARVGALRSTPRGFDPGDLGDLRRFVQHAWPEPLETTWGATPGTLEIHNPGRASRFLTALRVTVDGAPQRGLTLLNDSPGETGVPVPADALGPERGFYLRRGQTARVEGVAAGAALDVQIGLAGL